MVSHDSAKLNQYRTTVRLPLGVSLRKIPAMGRPRKIREAVPGSIADRLLRFMEARGLQQTEWARASGIPEQTLRSYLDGKMPGVDQMEALARGAGPDVTVDDLLRGGASQGQRSDRTLAAIISLIEQFEHRDLGEEARARLLEQAAHIRAKS
jgi:transcriptional regulator with XRE-family HTH domain